MYTTCDVTRHAHLVNWFLFVFINPSNIKYIVFVLYKHYIVHLIVPTHIKKIQIMRIMGLSSLAP